MIDFSIFSQINIFKEILIRRIKTLSRLIVGLIPGLKFNPGLN